MGRTFRDSCIADAANTTLNVHEFAESVTLTKPIGGTVSMTVNQRLSLLGAMPLPDGAISVYDRMQLLGLYRLGEGAEGGPETSEVVGQVILDIEDEQQGMVLDDANGRRVIRMARFVTSESTDITTNDVPDRCDTLTIDGEVWQCIRPEGRDRLAGTKTIVIRRDEKITTKKGRQRP